MTRTAAVVVRIVVLGALVLLVPFPAQAKCKRDCKQVIGGEFRTCKTACTKGKAGKSCRAMCASDRRANRTACRTATSPTPPSCGQSTTTTTPPTTTTLSGSATGVVGALTATPGRFNYNAELGLPGADAACGSNFSGAHACTLAELQAAPASQLAGLKDTGGNSVASFWAIDPTAPILQQCNDDVSSHLNWEYATAHTASRGEKVPLTNATGVLGALQTGVQCNIGGTSWVGCCR
jgi:hypothetical protein